MTLTELIKMVAKSRNNVETIDRDIVVEGRDHSMRVAQLSIEDVNEFGTDEQDWRIVVR